ncbi:nucleotidyltransferase family protein [Sphingomonas sp.]|uniref:nucleotidyltransferase family protein n=1 Tax=Sphingomonas sp. TaxID=28214 RepID=UPI002DD693A1|nr:NTP transferase domain-containing protein [Sphingomonas sp.]
MNAPAALILAGSRGGIDPVAADEGVSHKALIAVGGQPMLARVAEALRGAGIARIAVSADDPGVVALAGELGLAVLPPAAGPSRSVTVALGELGTPLIVTTADHALLEPRWVIDFLADVPPGADVAVLLAERAVVEAAMPGTRRTWLRFADGAWSGCNLFYLATPQAARAIDLWRTVEADRKRPWRIVRRFGVGTLLRYIAGRLTLAEGVARLGRTADVAAAAVPARAGLAAVDVDKAGDLADVRAIIASRG